MQSKEIIYIKTEQENMLMDTYIGLKIISTDYISTHLKTLNAIFSVNAFRTYSFFCQTWAHKLIST